MIRKILIIFCHFLFWSLSFWIITKVFGISTVEVMAESTGQEKVVIEYDDKFVWATLASITLCAFIFYINIFRLLPRYFQSKDFFRYIKNFLTIFILGIAICIIYNKYFNYPFSKDDIFPLFPSFGLHIALFIFYAAISFVYALTLEWYRNEKIRNEIMQEKLTSELNFLKAQINPHFLFNTLNNLYSIAQKHQIGDLTTGISELSNMMRYMLYESDTSFVSLQKEVNYLESFIEVQRLRYENDEFIVDFNKKGNLESVKIAPMILLPFVENAFKHGFSLDEISIVNIHLDVSDGNILFTIKNKVFEDKHLNDSASGIGLVNVRKRLDLIYPTKHKLEIFRNESHHHVKLNIECHA